MNEKISKTNDEWKNQLSSEESPFLLIKKELNELNNDSSNANKSIKVRVETEDGDYDVNIHEITVEDKFIVLESK